MVDVFARISPSVYRWMKLSRRRHLVEIARDLIRSFAQSASGTHRRVADAVAAWKNGRSPCSSSSSAVAPADRNRIQRRAPLRFRHRRCRRRDAGRSVFMGRFCRHRRCHNMAYHPVGRVQRAATPLRPVRSAMSPPPISRPATRNAFARRRANSDTPPRWASIV